jgi:hypothetical protein
MDFAILPYLTLPSPVGEGYRRFALNKYDFFKNRTRNAQRIKHFAKH